MLHIMRGYHSFLHAIDSALACHCTKFQACNKLAANVDLHARKSRPLSGWQAPRTNSHSNVLNQSQHCCVKHASSKSTMKPLAFITFMACNLPSTPYQHTRLSTLP